jgi:EPS-associated MarR family transcriptional regulator
MTHDISQEVRYRMLKYLSEHPDATQRELARELGVSVGKVNYCLRALIEKGLLKVRNFQNTKNKAAYAYLLTAHGIEEKVNVTHAFLRRKITEYDVLSKEIETLTAEVSEIAAPEPKSPG